MRDIWQGSEYTSLLKKLGRRSEKHATVVSEMTMTSTFKKQETWKNTSCQDEHTTSQFAS